MRRSTASITILGRSRHTGNKCRVPHCPDFLRSLVALIRSMCLSLMKGAHADLSSTAWQEIGVKPFGLSGIMALDLPLPVFPRPPDKNNLGVGYFVLRPLAGNGLVSAVLTQTLKAKDAAINFRKGPRTEQTSLHRIASRATIRSTGRGSVLFTLTDVPPWPMLKH
jgi:hypothetical protein